MKPRLSKVGMFWVCRTSDRVLGCGFSVEIAYRNWYRNKKLLQIIGY
jgi:hypothetical protein